MNPIKYIYTFKFERRRFVIIDFYVDTCRLFIRHYLLSECKTLQLKTATFYIMIAFISFYFIQRDFGFQSGTQRVVVPANKSYYNGNRACKFCTQKTYSTFRRNRNRSPNYLGTVPQSSGLAESSFSNFILTFYRRQQTRRL